LSISLPDIDRFKKNCNRDKKFAIHRLLNTHHTLTASLHYRCGYTGTKPGKPTTKHDSTHQGPHSRIFLGRS